MHCSRRVSCGSAARCRRRRVARARARRTVAAGRTEWRRQDHADTRARRPHCRPRAASRSTAVRSRALARASARARIAYLPQGHVFHWPLAVAAVVALGRHPHADPVRAADRGRPRRGRHARSPRPAASKLRGTRRSLTLSGGERARVALARALATEAPVLLADEPTASLDPRHQLMVMELAAHAAHAGGAVLAIMHDLALAARFADRVLVMRSGPDRRRCAARRGAYRRHASPMCSA